MASEEKVMGRNIRVNGKYSYHPVIGYNSKGVFIKENDKDVFIQDGYYTIIDKRYILKEEASESVRFKINYLIDENEKLKKEILILKTELTREIDNLYEKVGLHRRIMQNNVNMRYGSSDDLERM